MRQGVPNFFRSLSSLFCACLMRQNLHDGTQTIRNLGTINILTKFGNDLRKRVDAGALRMIISAQNDLTHTKIGKKQYISYDKT